MRPKTPEPRSTEITSEALYQRRRDFLKNAALFAATSLASGGALVALAGGGRASSKRGAGNRPLLADSGAPSTSAALAKSNAAPSRFDTDEEKTPFEDVTTYNNYYELGLSKSAPAEAGDRIRARPWSIAFEGEIARPGVVDLDTILGWFALEERVYRMRCVEAWSMVIPWLGLPLADLVKKLEPTSRAKYIEFTTLYDPEELPGQSRRVLDWPYTEGLRIDEATNPLALLAVGLYGKALLGQNGAPIRLVVPWKYGFKGIKSIVKMRFVASQPKTAWNEAAPREYGFYANVNPSVDHPRWSQATERRIGELRRRDTRIFNGYGDDVASLYAGLDLRENF